MTKDEADRAGIVWIDGEPYAANHRKARIARGRANLVLGDTGQIAELERSVRAGTLGAVQVQKNAPRNVLVRVTAVRKRFVDEDNLCEKYHVDCCRYSGLIFGDSPATTRIEVRQEKAGKGGREYVRIEIFKR